MTALVTSEHKAKNATPIADVVTSQLEGATPKEIAIFLQEALETGDTKHFARCVGIAAKAVGMTEIAERTGMKCPALYRLTDIVNRASIRL